MQSTPAQVPTEVCERLDSADKLTDNDRKAIIQIARESLARFQPKIEAEAAKKEKT
jgi:F-type H+/Na+-transporting ATPase subunit alpha